MEAYQNLADTKKAFEIRESVVVTTVTPTQFYFSTEAQFDANINKSNQIFYGYCSIQIINIGAINQLNFNLRDKSDYPTFNFNTQNLSTQSRNIELQNVLINNLKLLVVNNLEIHCYVYGYKLNFT